jgi:hypothetical protein
VDTITSLRISDGGVSALVKGLSGCIAVHLGGCLYGKISWMGRELKCGGFLRVSRYRQYEREIG